MLRWTYDCSQCGTRPILALCYEAAPRLVRIARATLEFDIRPRATEMNSPASMTLSRSTPVSMPSPFSMYTTSSVATFPGGSLGVGAAAKACHGTIEHGHAYLQRSINVREGLAVGVVV